jgi:transcriptional regulator with XRE-family HTH domain
MDALRTARQRQSLSQREFAARAGLSFRGYQLLESPLHNARIASLEKVVGVLGLPTASVRRVIGDLVALHPESIRAAGLRILADGPRSWTVHLFDFVDAFRRTRDPELVRMPIPALGEERLAALLTSTVEALCGEALLPEPGWCQAVPGLSEPWFVSGMENLKPSALAESPVPFRRRNVFVLRNFLARA